MERSENLSHHQIIMQNRSLLELTDVEDVDTFDDSEVVVKTTLGDLIIKGHHLHVLKLNLENGSLSIDGKVDSLTYSEPTRGLFGRLLR